MSLYEYEPEQDQTNIWNLLGVEPGSYDVGTLIMYEVEGPNGERGFMLVAICDCQADDEHSAPHLRPLPRHDGIDAWEQPFVFIESGQAVT